MKTSTGHCLCGAVAITVPEACTHEVSVCHCGMCRQWGSGPLMALECNSEVAITGQENITTYRSSEWAERAFCRICGSHLYYKLLSTGQHELSAGLFPSAEQRLTLQIYVDHKPEFYDLAQQTEMLTEQQLLERMMPAGEA